MKDSFEINYLASQIIYFLDNYHFSPNCYFAQKILVKKPNGKQISLASAYRKLKNDVNYVDDELLDKINSHDCIIKKLKKDCNK